MEDGGRIGLGTSTPVVDLHIKSGNTPTLRLEQDGSSGFTPQTWDVAGNEANFFVRDATNGSTLPFRIFPGAPSNAFTVEASTGDIGINTTSPGARLHIAKPNGSAIAIESTDGSHRWDFVIDSTSRLKISKVGTGGSELIIDDSGLLRIKGDLRVIGNLTVDGRCTGC